MSTVTYTQLNIYIYIHGLMELQGFSTDGCIDIGLCNCIRSFI